MSIFSKQESQLDYPALIERCLGGDHRAQKMLFDQFAGKMLYVCMRYARDQTEAEDMTQEGFIRLFKNLHTYKHKGSFEGWVRRVFVNTAIKYYHKVNKHNGHMQVEDAHTEHVDATAIARLSEEELLEIIRSLPDGYRTVFNLYAIEGYSHKEIADLLDINESTSRSQLVKARKQLQNQVSHLQKVLL